jgi:hypothetical protein
VKVNTPFAIIIASVILAMAVIVHAFRHRYQLVGIAERSAIRLNTYTGVTDVCIAQVNKNIDEFQLIAPCTGR